MDLKPFYDCVLFSLINQLACAAFVQRDLEGKPVIDSESPNSPELPIVVGSSINKAFSLKANKNVKVIFLPKMIRKINQLLRIRPNLRTFKQSSS